MCFIAWRNTRSSWVFPSHQRELFVAWLKKGVVDVIMFAPSIPSVPCRSVAWWRWTDLSIVSVTFHNIEFRSLWAEWVYSGLYEDVRVLKRAPNTAGQARSSVIFTTHFKREDFAFKKRGSNPRKHPGSISVLYNHTMLCRVPSYEGTEEGNSPSQMFSPEKNSEPIPDFRKSSVRM